MTASATTQITASPAKLRDGSWGARCPGRAPAVGSTITIRTAGGKSWDAQVTKVVVQFDDAALVSTASAPKTSAPARSTTPRYSTYRRTGCGYPGCNGRNFCDECSD